MIEIPLTQGQVAIVDDEFAELAKFKWCVSWIKKMGVYYAVRGVTKDGKAKKVYLHRAVMEMRLGRELVRGEMVNHVDNRLTLDCRMSNLTPRPVTVSENNRWLGLSRVNTSGFKGVSWAKSDGKWRADIRVDGRGRFLGNFSSVHEAAVAYDMACIRLHGDFARPNFPRSAYKMSI